MGRLAPPSQMVYIRASLPFGELSNGDYFIGVDPASFVGKPVTRIDSMVGVVLQAHRQSENTTQVLMEVDRQFAERLGIMDGDVSIGCGGFQAAEGEPMEITHVSIDPRR